MHDRPAKYVENHDGDSVTMLLDQDFFDTKQINIRLANVWAPEMNKDEGAEEVQRFVFEWFNRRITAKNDGWDFMVITHQTSTGKEKKTLDRFVADVMSADGKEHLNSEVMAYIIEKGYPRGVGAP